MDTLNTIAIILFGAFILWRLFVYIRSKPESLNKESIGKSSSTMLWILLGLIVFVGSVAMIL